MLSDVSEYCSDNDCTSISGVYFPLDGDNACNDNVSCTKTDDEIYDSSNQFGSTWSDDDDRCEYSA